MCNAEYNIHRVSPLSPHPPPSPLSPPSPLLPTNKATPNPMSVQVAPPFRVIPIDV